MLAVHARLLITLLSVSVQGLEFLLFVTAKMYRSNKVNQLVQYLVFTRKFVPFYITCLKLNRIIGVSKVGEKVTSFFSQLSFQPLISNFEHVRGIDGGATFLLSEFGRIKIPLRLKKRPPSLFTLSLKILGSIEFQRFGCQDFTPSRWLGKRTVSCCTCI